MTSAAPVPEPFKPWVDLSSDVLGTFVLYATDDYFAGKENLVQAHAAVWLSEEYTDKGKWMDGWESQRRREPGHDFAVLRLGAPGRVMGALVDTTHFKGNAPQEVSLEGIEAPHTSTPAQLNASTAWFSLLPQVAVKPDFGNVLLRSELSPRVTHVRLRIFPDGGVARLRVYGEVAPEPRTFWKHGSIDLGATENGGTIAAVSDAFFGPASNMLLPGRGVNMGSGWETKRRRTPGSDWAVVKLGRRGTLDRIELDTHFFKGNAPQAVLIESIDASTLTPDALAKRLAAPTGWDVLVDRTPLVQHRRHQLEPIRPRVVTHVRVHIFPHGGVNRLRLFGSAVDTAAEHSALSALNAMSEARARTTFLSFCGSSAWADGMLEMRPYPSLRALFAHADAVWWGLSNPDWHEAFKAHPRIGANKKAPSQSARAGALSKGEQRQVGQADPKVLAKLKRLNDAYFKKFGFIFICFATGKSAEQMLALLETRLERTVSAEVETAAAEQSKITRLRLEKWLQAKMEA